MKEEKFRVYRVRNTRTQEAKTKSKDQEGNETPHIITMKQNIIIQTTHGDQKGKAAMRQVEGKHTTSEYVTRKKEQKAGRRGKHAVVVV